MFGFLAPQQLFLVVQEKLDCPVSKIGLSGFCGLKPRTDFTSSLFFSLLSLSHTLKNNCEDDPKTPFGYSMVPPWNLGVLG
jgi:hypothetical protein